MTTVLHKIWKRSPGLSDEGGSRHHILNEASPQSSGIIALTRICMIGIIVVREEPHLDLKKSDRSIDKPYDYGLRSLQSGLQNVW
jgi:hypothetical protein